MLILNKSAATRGSDFKHEPLPHSITHIRLLEVLPTLDPQDLTIRCRLKNVRLADYDQCYNALSYAWNHHDDDHVVFVNNQEVSIKRNLYNFLCLYRQKLLLKALPSVFLWIDALCLDHSNARERSSQAQIMPNIFSKAKTVLAWLEPPSTDAKAPGGHGSLQKFVSFLEQIKTDLQQPQTSSHDRYLRTKYCPVSNGAIGQFSAEWSVLHYLCEHRYWSRLWILQENRYAQNLMFVHGDVFWTWAEFRAPFLLMWYLVESQLYKPASTIGSDPTHILYSPAMDVVKTRLNFERVGRFSSACREFRYSDIATETWQYISERKQLSELLRTHRSRLCSDPSDKVYALVGLSNSSLTVDYDRTNIELFCAVLLSLKISLELDFVSLLAHQLGVSAFQYQQNRRSILKDVPSTMPDQMVSDIVGRNCHTVFAVKSIPARTEISDIMQSRLGVQKLNYYRITAQQDMDKMTHWNDFPASSKDMPQVYGHTPGTTMPIVDGFDLSDTSFRAAMFLNPTSRSNRKAVFGMISTDIVQDGDILITEDQMYSGIIIRISGLSKTWLTVTGVVLFARKVTVESEIASPLSPSSPTSTIRSATLSNFCEYTYPTPFTIMGFDDNDHFTLRPHDIQLHSLFVGTEISSGRQSRSSTNSNSTTKTAWSKKFKPNERRLTSKSDRLERILDIISPHKRRHSK